MTLHIWKTHKTGLLFVWDFKYVTDENIAFDYRPSRFSQGGIKVTKEM